MKKILIVTGPASCGKTTLVNELKKMDYNIIEEAATVVIPKWYEKGYELPWINPTPDKWLHFEKDIHDTNILLIEKALDEKNNGYFVMDRSTIDVFAYIHMLIGEKYISHIKDFHKMPHEIFSVKTKDITSIILKKLPFVDNGIRYESEEPDQIQNNQYKILKKYYEASPYILFTENKALSINERIDFIKKIMS